MNVIEQLDGIVRETLVAFASDVFREGWLGKEQDCVNRYAHGYLEPADDLTGGTSKARHGVKDEGSMGSNFVRVASVGEFKPADAKRGPGARTGDRSVQRRRRVPRTEKWRVKA